MVMQAFAFYLFAGILVLSALMVITARNPVHSVLFLILAFLNTAGLFVLLGAEFLAMILVIIYVGAVAVLFLFVVMMLDIDFAHLRRNVMKFVPFGILIAAILLFELVTIYIYWHSSADVQENIALDTGAFEGLSNTQSIGMMLYTDYIFAFQISGLILLVAMIGAVVLTLHKRSNARKQNIHEQHKRQASDVLELKKVTPRTGI